MKRILVPTDFSATAERALRLAMDFSSKAGGAVILYHVHKPLDNEFVGTIDERDMYNKQTEVNLVKKMHRLKRKVTKDTDVVPVSAILGRAPVVTNILGFAEANKVDMIIMGTQGATGLKKTIIGTVAAKIAENADIPVLLVPEKYDWKDPRDLVFACNYTKSDKQALSLLVSISNAYDSSVTLLHLLNAYLNAEEKAKAKTIFDTYAYKMQKAAGDQKLKIKMIETDSVIETMESLDKKIPYDLIAMVRRQKGFYEKFFLGSFTKSMAYITNRLLLVIPEDDEKVSVKKNGRNEIAIPSKSNLQIEKIIKKKKR